MCSKTESIRKYILYFTIHTELKVDTLKLYTDTKIQIQLYVISPTYH